MIIKYYKGSMDVDINSFVPTKQAVITLDR